MGKKKDTRKALSAQLASDLMENIGGGVLTPSEIVKHFIMTVKDTDQEIKDEISDVYDTLPRVKFEAWLRVNSKKITKKKVRDQMSLAKRFAVLFDVEDIYVVARNYSDDTMYPVYQLDVPEYGLLVTFGSHDFKTWGVSVAIDMPLEEFHKTGHLSKVDLEFTGFPEDVKYKESFAENNRRFSVKLESDFELYTFMYNLKNHLER